jgi:hypothetical protein
MINPKAALDPNIKDPSGFFDPDKVEPIEMLNMEPLVQTFGDNVSLYNTTILDSSDYQPPVRCKKVDPDAVLWSYMQYFAQRPYLSDIEFVPLIISTYHKFQNKFEKMNHCKNRDVIWVALICRLLVEITFLKMKVAKEFE